MATPPAVAAETTPSGPVELSDDDIRRIDAYWRAANYLSVGQIYLMDNPLMREPPQTPPPRQN